MVDNVGSGMEKQNDTAADNKPGNGWSNGDVPVLGSVYTREGKLQLYQKERRWISLSSSWARHTGDANDTHHAASARGEVKVTSKEEEAVTIKSLMSQLCEKFYVFGWKPGTGGGMALRSEDGKRVYCTPSGIQKEDMIGDDVFEMNMDMEVTCPPATPGLQLSSMTNLWFLVYKLRPQAKCVIHTHSLNAKLVTLLDSHKDSFKISHFEMLKGVGNHGYADTLEIPIIENQPSESLLYKDMELAITAFPKCNAVLVRRHGVYVWGDSWEQAKTQLESFDYLFQTAVQMKQMGLSLDPATTIASQAPGQYRQGNFQSASAADMEPRTTSQQEIVLDDERPNKRKKMEEEKKESNMPPVRKQRTIPLLPKHGKVLVLDVGGCTTTPVTYETDTFKKMMDDSSLFASYLECQTTADIKALWESLDHEVKVLEVTHPVKVHILKQIQENVTVEYKPILTIYVNGMAKYSYSSKKFLELQRSIWEYGIQSGALKGHVYADVLPMFQWMTNHDIPIHIYSSNTTDTNTSLTTQAMFWKHSNQGDLSSYITQIHSEPKKCADILSSFPTNQILLVSSNLKELSLAKEKGGIGHSVYAIRSDHHATDNDDAPEQLPFPCIHSLLQICGSNN